jgi:hypothetical protein
VNQRQLLRQLRQLHNEIIEAEERRNQLRGVERRRADRRLYLLRGRRRRVERLLAELAA